MSETKPVTMELTPELLIDIDKCYTAFSPDYADFTKLKYYDKLLDTPESIQGEDLIKAGDETIRAMSLANDYRYIATRFAKYGETYREKVAANLFFREIPAFLIKNNSKDTDAAKKRALDDDASYREADLLKNGWLALVDWLDGRFQIYLQKQQWVRKQLESKKEGF